MANAFERGTWGFIAVSLPNEFTIVLRGTIDAFLLPPLPPK